MNEIEKTLILFRRKIDQIDSTPFGELGKLFDDMATLGDKALHVIEKQQKAGAEPSPWTGNER